MKLTLSDQPTAIAPTVLRSLGTFEEFFWLIDQNRPVHFALAAQVRGPTTIRRWRAALDLAQRRHPLFSVCIEKNGNSHPHFHQETATPIPLRVVQGNQVIERWESEIELELSKPFDARQAPLVRAVLLHEANRAVCILVVHQSIADGLSIAFVIRDLLRVLSGSSIHLLPVIPSHEEILGVTRNRLGPAELSKESNTAPARPAVYLAKDYSRPRVRGLRLTPALTTKLRQRARREGTSVHGALSSALALAYWQTIHELREEPIRIFSPIDTRKLLSLGDDCAVLVDGGTVGIEPYTSTAFWDIARHSMAGLAKARTLESILASRNRLHQMVRNGIDVATAAAIAAHEFAHEILLSNLGNLRYGSDFGELKLEAIWGPAVSIRIEGGLTIGVATTNGALCLLETSFSPTESLLNIAEKILVSACVEAAID
jgi:hypothetical protein